LKFEPSTRKVEKSDLEPLGFACSLWKGDEHKDEQNEALDQASTNTNETKENGSKNAASQFFALILLFSCFSLPFAVSR